MKKFVQTFIIQLNLFIICVLPTIFLYLILVNPVWENAWCGKHECHTIQHHIIYSIEEFRDVPLTNKEKIEITEVKDNVFKTSIYYLGTHEKIYNELKSTYIDKNRYVFGTGYLSKRNAERDMNIIKNHDNIHVIKKNPVLITILCSIIYIILLSLSIIVTMISKEVKEHKSEEYGSGKN